MVDDKVKIEITQDKLIDILMHSATREDIAKLDNKIEAKFDAVIAEFKRSNEALETRIDNKFESLESRVSREFQKIDNRYNWIIGTIIAASIAVIGVIVKLH